MSNHLDRQRGIIWEQPGHSQDWEQVSGFMIYDLFMYLLEVPAVNFNPGIDCCSKGKGIVYHKLVRILRSFCGSFRTKPNKHSFKNRSFLQPLYDATLKQHRYHLLSQTRQWNKLNFAASVCLESGETFIWSIISLSMKRRALAPVCEPIRDITTLIRAVALLLSRAEGGNLLRQLWLHPRCKHRNNKRQMSIIFWQAITF